ncbi:glycosyl transferase [Desulfosarcina alkanivorans]|uniref:Glycosyl transferase n=1 Tax=Desulfosarcina alkanivorans TaxID=571177 RepID=A0A5K7YIX0_9BACT|nr:glycosyltransferase [Desulfosarcina alkanivorans]BBO68335.1 glycosyl transferase [Desulfosarcina alkanivorans]
MRIDLHVHSKFSERPSQWILKKLDCPESFTEPLQLYDIARRRGMTHVTITDHNSIGGALEIAHLPGAFVSEEVTSYFPEDGCKLHVLALDITESQHVDIQRLRKNIFDLVAYFEQEKIFNIIAHPLYAVNDRLTVDHFERLLLLFRNFELNGARNSRENQTLRRLLNQLTPDDIQRLVDRHGITPSFPHPHQKRLFGGSDDHSGLNVARTYTEFTGDPDTGTSLSAIENSRVVVHATAPSPQTMAHNLYGIAWQFFRRKFNLGQYAGKDPLVRFLDGSLGLDPAPEPGMLSRVYFFFSAKKNKRVKHPLSDSLASLLRHETQKLIDENPDLLAADRKDGGQDEAREGQWFEFVNRLSNRVMVHFGNHLLDHLSGANVFNIFHTIGSAGGMTTLLAPYFVAYSQFTMGRDLGNQIAGRFGRPPGDQTPAPAGDTHVAHFTDTFYEVNGVALTLRQQVQSAAAADRRYTLITCDDRNRPSEKGVAHFTPIGTYDLPEYEQQKIFYPPVLEMLDYCHRQGFNHIHTATPGPIGLAALAIARFLRLPISGTYHTAIPQYVQVLTGSGFMEDLAWKFVLWYYDQMDLIYAPSRSTREELVARGISAEKIKVYPRGIDTGRFNPSRRNGFFKRWHCDAQTTKLIYVGRVSKEKNLHLLSQAYRRLVQSTPSVVLTVVGDGPYLDEMKAENRGLPCIFTGRLEGDDLASAYASSDIFVFPSTTDTFGNVVLEAQASGVPVIVTDQGGPAENVIPEKTGLVVKGNCARAILSAMESLVADSRRRSEMGRAAREYMEDRSFEAAFNETWKMFGTLNADKMAMAG